MRRLGFLAVIAFGGCSGSEQALTVSLPVATSGGAIPAVTTDLGYQVEVSQIRIAISTVQFTIEGEMHEGDTALRIAPPPHPGHSSGGEVTGELPGNFILAWNGQQHVLGNGTLIVGDYQGANFAFRAADADDQLVANDRLLGHTFHITGQVSKAGTTKSFDAVLDVEADSEVIGAVFEDVITETSTETLAIQFQPTDPYELDTAFDGVEFFQLPETAGAIAIDPGSAAHNIIRRAIQTHDHYAVVAQ